MVKIATSIRVEDKLFKALKKLAFENETTQTQLINDYIIAGLKKDGVNVDEFLKSKENNSKNNCLQFYKQLL